MNTHSPSIELLPFGSLRPYPGNARTHSKKQIGQIAESIKRFGFTNLVLIGDGGEILAGHGRVRAAKELGLADVPVVRLSHLTPAERRAYVLADNKLALNAGWDSEVLAIELQGLINLDFDVTLTGFSLAEVDFALDHAREASPATVDDDADRIVAPSSGPSVSRTGDLWRLGRHRLLCGDARSSEDVDQLVGGERIDLIFTDPPCNVAIDGNVGGLGSVRHREFAFASGEMSREEFTHFLTVTLSNAARVAKDGAIAFVCMDWRHMREMLDAGEAAFTELKNLCVWNKTNGGMGTFYRSKHELVFVFKVGSSPHTNSFGLGDSGRYRTNVWDYAGISSLGAKRMEDLAMHPTVKPVALVADAIKDCSRRGETVLDLFSGSGSTLIAAEQCGRAARLIEYDPLYCDTIIEFNTTTSMGRLTLNVLLSFAQFEREVTAERIRDKIAASKQKGMFMGGRVPLGYRLDNRKLEVDEDDADYVRHLFHRVLELKSVSAVKHEIDAACESYAMGNAEMETPRRWRAMTHGQLRYLLSNPTYIGKITHKGRLHDGEQQAIVSKDLFDAVQAEISEIRTAGRRGRGAPDIHLLNGIAFDETGDRLGPSSAAKGLRRYRYYLSHRLQKNSRGRKDGWRLPADAFERIALSQANAVVENASLISTWLEQARAGNAIAAALNRLDDLKDDLSSPDPFRRRDCIRLIFKAITVAPNDIRFDINRDALIKALIPADQQGLAKPTIPSDDPQDDETSTITASMTMKRRGVEMCMVVQGGAGCEPDKALIDLIARAHVYLDSLTNGSASSIAELADQLGVHRADISRILPLAFLSPQLTESILSGRQPADLTVRTLSRLVDIPASWSEQSALLGG